MNLEIWCLPNSLFDMYQIYYLKKLKCITDANKNMLDFLKLIHCSMNKKTRQILEEKDLYPK